MELYSVVNNRLSHSQINKFLTCQHSWFLHYRQGYRSRDASSALMFGLAIGKTFEYMLNPDMEFKKNRVLNEFAFFDEQWSHQKFNDEVISLKDYSYMSYFKSDLDMALLTTEEIQEAKNNINLLSWFSMRQKGHLMIKALKEDLIPLIEHVYSIEEKIELSNDEGDSSIGYSDIVVKLKDYDKPIILDFKTASSEYEQDSVKKSVQLSQYLHALSDKYNTRLAGYMVFLKRIEKNTKRICSSCKFEATGSHKTCNNMVSGKRCNANWIETLDPKCRTQLIIDEIPIETEELIIDNIENINNSIKTGIYPKNVNACWDIFGKPCEFVNLCWKKSEENLIRVEVKNETRTNINK